MINSNSRYTSIWALSGLLALVLFSSCSKDEQSDPVQRVSTYNLVQKDVLGVSGQVSFRQNSSTLTTIEIMLSGAPGGIHPAELRMNSAVEGGTVVLNLTPVDATGNSSTEVNALTYNQLIAYDGYIQISNSSTQANVILAQGDIGGNVITTTRRSFSLDTIGSFSVSGTALFEKRVNGNTLLTVSLLGAITGEIYPATINLSSIQTVGGGPVVKELNNVDGTSGESITNIRTLKSGLNITYDNWMVYDGYINVYQDSVSLNSIICHGNIGSN